MKISTTANDTIDPFKADVLAAYSQYPFGMLQPDMYSEAGTTYRLGFNGMLRDDDMKDLTTTSPTPNEGVGNSYATQFRLYDPRTSRWFSPDPLKAQFPSVSPYIGMGNNPVIYIDPFGDSTFVYGDNTPNIVKDLSEQFPELSLTASPIGAASNQASLITSQVNKSFDGPISPAANTFMDASKSTDVNVNLFAITGAEQAHDEKDIVVNIHPGVFGGNFPSLNDATKREGIQYLNYEMTKKFESVGLTKRGEIPAHEIIESYIGAKNRSGFLSAHNATLKLIPSDQIDEYIRTTGTIAEYFYSAPTISPIWHKLYTKVVGINYTTYSTSSDLLNLIKRRGK